MTDEFQFDLHLLGTAPNPDTLPFETFSLIGTEKLEVVVQIRHPHAVDPNGPVDWIDQRGGMFHHIE